MAFGLFETLDGCTKWKWIVAYLPRFRFDMLERHAGPPFPPDINKIPSFRYRNYTLQEVRRDVSGGEYAFYLEELE